MKRQILQLIGDYKSRLSSINEMIDEHRKNFNGSISSIRTSGRLNGKAEEYRFAISELERIVRESNSIEIEIPPSILSSMDALNIPKDKREKVYEVYLAYTLGITINTEEEEFSNWADIYKGDVEDIVKS